ncbi:YggS family pyridoxal phosphate-dependent enzyme [Pasteurellaceae bacterium HPA106]|uniref:YggS family pyridoxal phosphate-dependent enzyme n=1 Tax=Spirabiliibacterium pneumoniae TaxID=221400 RepID=UPI001AAD75AE|nr:YggS family pyridoxal phosphate-dependent enzyme [Spirabiliibacterium pneumoniae]MBE2895522.1 YggS family pyridoxal phosphate-dependent enzyme [Spirabiliibacterium pneumoniae]
MSISENIAHIQGQISQACIQANRTLETVKLLAVSKTKPVEAILEAVRAGLQAFGENYVQEGVEKITYFQHQGIALEWHFIGPLQSNKTRLVAEHFDWVESVEREKIAQRLSEQRPAGMAPLNVLIQVNISQETSKSGVAYDEVIALAQRIATLDNLALRGLMAIPAPQHSREAFAKMQTLFVALQQALPECNIDTLSMGMSDDMAQAIEYGSTEVRIGTAIFGARQYNKN